ncbi:nuclear localization sequence binding protein [Friedmanniomyces endolithicus]|uniref:Nuclear localization sequence binding protein n=1 Tax=Rachicladosporium monterosium TaxID=1507873 RepID=A0ABR0LJ21_9PEZI|nr:nuclear localization sequence binding protein [Friedmanniomyces endolithicus]KAK1089769.1 nuclear localization sequence binding protein [Friedmanniomyces endolithicus]KAK5148664.1 nuclear localization sequence binding protein [Rachicladosporium monterosium]
MAKDKKGSKAAAAPAPQVAKPAEKVKAGRVTKPAETPKVVAQTTAKKAAKTVENGSKKSKKAPSDDEDTSDSSASSEGESDEEVAPAKPAAKTNGAAKAVLPSVDSSDEDDEDDSSDGSSEDEKVDTKAGAQKLVAETKKQEAKEDEDMSDDSESDDEAPAAKANGAAAASDSDDSSEDDEEDDEEEKPAPAAKTEATPSKKRKADAEPEQTPKRSKIMVDGVPKEPTANLFIGGLSWDVDEEWLGREFEEYGEMEGVRIITDRETGKSKGFGYIQFKELDSAIKAQENRNGYEINGRNIRVDFSEPRGEKNGATPQQRSANRADKYGDAPKEPSSTLFVGNVSFEADESSLSELFAEHGGIKSVRLPTDRETGAIKGFGYVEFTSIEEATAAYEACNGADVAGRAIRLDYASARPDNGGDRGGRGGGFGGRGGDRGGRGGGRGRGGFDRGGRGGGRGRGGFGGDRGGRGGGRGGSFNRGGFGDFSGKKKTFE